MNTRISRRSVLLVLVSLVMTGVAYAQAGRATFTPSQSQVLAGTRVQLTASPAQPSGGYTQYMWRSTDGRVFGRGGSVEFDTTGLAPGNYEVTLAGFGANCIEPLDTKTITVIACPPDLRLTSSTLRVRPGEVISVNAAGVPSGFTLTWSSSAGRLVESGDSVTLDTAGLSPGTITVSATAVGVPDCTRDIAVVLEAPPVALPDILSFPMTGGRLNNANKSILDDVSIRSTQDVGSRLVITGRSTAGERRGIANTRAENARNYLVNEKGIDPARIEVRVEEGTAPEGGVQVAIVPPGAQF